MTEPLRILVLAANPIDTQRLALEQEFRLIRNRMRDNAETGNCELIFEWAVRPEDLQQALLDHKPHIVHFGCHGENRGICLEDDEGRMVTVSKEQLTLLFNLVRKHLRLVVLNACYAVKQVDSLRALIDYVVGAAEAIADKAAVQFSGNFYRELAVGRTVREAFYQAQGKLEDIGDSNKSASYQLLIRPGTDETAPLLPPAADTTVNADISNTLIADEINIARGIFRTVDPTVATSKIPTNERRKIKFSAKDVKVGKFNLADTITGSED